MSPFSPSGVAFFPDGPAPAPKSNHKKRHGTPAFAKKHKAKRAIKKKKKKPKTCLSEGARIAANDAKEDRLP